MVENVAFRFPCGFKIHLKSTVYDANISKFTRDLDALPCETVASKIVESSILYVRLLRAVLNENYYSKSERNKKNFEAITTTTRARNFPPILLHCQP